MRRTLFVALVLGLVLAAAVPAGAKEVYNGSQSAIQLYGYWGSYDDATGAWVDAGAYVTEYGSETWLEYYHFSSTPITCGDDIPGWEYTSIWASGPTELTAGKSYSTAQASANVTGYVESWTECWYPEESVSVENGGGGEELTFDVMISFTATSPLIREKSSSSFKVPGEWNSHDTYSSVYRSGDIHAMVDGEHFYGGGQFGKVSWKTHYNAK